jgi:hypothetical protein
MKRYRIPTHLTVEPSLVRAELGPIPVDLTFRQATALALAAGFAYWAWQGSGLPAAFVIALTTAALPVALLAAFVAVGGRSADLWLRDLLRHLARPRRLTWRATTETDPASPDSAAAPTVAPLALAWAPPRPTPPPLPAGDD